MGELPKDTMNSNCDNFESTLYMKSVIMPLMLYTLAVDLCWGKLKVETFSQSSSGYLKNHWTNTRLVCTHFNAFLMFIQICQ